MFGSSNSIMSWILEQRPKVLISSNTIILFQLSTIDFSHKIFSGPSEHLPAMNRVKKIVASYNFSSKVFAVGHNYASWETDEIIQWETFQNVGISLVVVFIATALLLAHFQVRNKRKSKRNEKNLSSFPSLDKTF